MNKKIIYQALEDWDNARKAVDNCSSMILSSGKTEEAAQLMENLAIAELNLIHVKQALQRELNL